MSISPLVGVAANEAPWKQLSIEIDNVEVDQRFLAYSPEPLPRAIPTRDPDAASSASNDFYDRAIQLGYAADESQKNKFVLSRPFDLRVGYFSGFEIYSFFSHNGSHHYAPLSRPRPLAQFSYYLTIPVFSFSFQS